MTSAAHQHQPHSHTHHHLSMPRSQTLRALASPMASTGDLILNIVALLSEGFGTGFIALVGIGLFIVFYPLLGAVGLGLMTLVMTSVLWVRSGAHFNPGVTACKTLAYMTGAHFREYYGGGNRAWDLIVGALYIGAQLAGAIVGVLTLRSVDNTNVVPLVTETKPFGILAGDDKGAFLLTYLLNVAVIIAVMAKTMPRVSALYRAFITPIVSGGVVAACVALSVAFGTGSLLNFALDFAIAMLIRGSTDKKLWISFVAQLVAAVTVWVLVLVMAKCDDLLEHKIHRVGNAGKRADADSKRMAPLAVLFHMLRDVDMSAAALLTPTTSDDQEQHSTAEVGV